MCALSPPGAPSGRPQLLFHPLLSGAGAAVSLQRGRCIRVPRCEQCSSRDLRDDRAGIPVLVGTVMHKYKLSRDQRAGGTGRGQPSPAPLRGLASLHRPSLDQPRASHPGLGEGYASSLPRDRGTGVTLRTDSLSCC